MIRPRTAWLLFALLVVVLGSFLIWPLFKVIGGGCFVDGHFTPEYLLGVFGEMYRFELPEPAAELPHEPL